MGLPQKTELNETDRDVILRCLLEYYSGSGDSLTAVLDSSPGISSSTYYRYKQQFPDEIALIDSKAKSLAKSIQDGRQTHIDSVLLERTQAIQEQAIAAIESALPVITRTATGENWSEDVRVFPRDANKALEILLDIARNGVVSGISTYTRALEKTLKPDSAGRGGLEELPMLGAPSQFSKVEATALDGSRITIERGDSVDAEVVELEGD